MTSDAPLTRNAALYGALSLGLGTCLIATLLAGLLGFDPVESRLGQVACCIGIVFGTCGGFVLLSECTEQTWLKLRLVRWTGRTLRVALSLVPFIGPAIFLVIFALPLPLLAYAGLLPGAVLITVTFLEARADRSPT